MSSNLEVALSYAQNLGWAVLPLQGIKDGQCTCRHPATCQSPGKHPLLSNGVHGASKDPAKIASWWQQRPTANVGIATGAVSGFWVLDVDGPTGRDSLEELESTHGKLPATVEALTGGGGRHILLTHPRHVIKNAVALAPGLDVRGDGGYIVAPPSLHKSGRTYEWEVCSEPGDVSLAAAPAWLLDMLTPTTAKPRVDWTENLTQGKRNAELTRRAGSLLQKMPAAEALTMLLAWNKEHCHPPLTTGEVRGIVHSIAKREAEKPLTYQTDTGLAERLVRDHGDDLRYCWPWGKWLVWDGRRWVVDNTAEVRRRVKATVRAMYSDASRVEDETERKALIKFAAKSEQRDRLSAALDLAASEHGVPILPESFDADPWKFNVLNGTIDLKTGKLMPHCREDALTKIASIEYSPTALCPRWTQFLHEIMDGNQNLIKFLQRAIGMSLTGDTSEHILPVLYGTGRNGKSTLLNTVQDLMGDYAIQAAPDLLLTKKNDTHPTELADLFGKRLVTAIESGEGRRLAEALIKQLTGGDKIRARRMREDFWEFWPTHKIWLATNHRPKVAGTDAGIWSRIKLIPFNVQYLDGDPRQDKQLPAKLKAEHAGILRWAVEGCLAWQRDGLMIPDEVKKATEDYREEQDVMAAFLAECCMVNPLAKVAVKELYEAYAKWCDGAGEKMETQRNFGKKLTDRGFERVRGGKAGSYIWRGLGVQSQVDMLLGTSKPAPPRTYEEF